MPATFFFIARTSHKHLFYGARGKPSRCASACRLAGLSLARSLYPYRYDVARPIFQDRRDMLGPTCQRGLDLRAIRMLVVNRDDAFLAMADHKLGDMRRN